MSTVYNVCRRYKSLEQVVKLGAESVVAKGIVWVVTSATAIIRVRAVCISFAGFFAEASIAHVADHIATAEALAIIDRCASSLACSAPASHRAAAVIVVFALVTILFQALISFLR